MKCKWISNTDTHFASHDAEHQAKMLWRTVTDERTGQPRRDEYFPAGSELDHPDAWKFVNWGMATASDAECEAACKPMSDADRAALQLSYQADALGIHDPDHRKLFFDGVILGYQKLAPDADLVFIPGPNYPAYKAAKDAAATKAETDI